MRNDRQAGSRARPGARWCRVASAANCVAMDGGSREADHHRVRCERDGADERPEHECVAAAGRTHAHQGNETQEQARDRGAGDETGDTKSAVVATRVDRSARIFARTGRQGLQDAADDAAVSSRDRDREARHAWSPRSLRRNGFDPIRCHQGPEQPRHSRLACLSTVPAAAVPCVGSEATTSALGRKPDSVTSTPEKLLLERRNSAYAPPSHPAETRGALIPICFRSRSVT